MSQVPIVIDGMTGTGKTTLVNTLSEKLSLEVMPEEFRDPYDLLNKFAHDSKWCYPMQLNFLMTRYIQYTVASESESYLLDRSIYSDPVYAKLYYKMGHLSEQQYNNYLTFYNNLMEDIVEPKCIILLSCSFEEVMKRIKSRGRSDELKLGEKEYWWPLFQAYDEHLNKILSEKDNMASKLIHIDTENLDLNNIDEELSGVVNEAKAII